jgi:hypothetical protein
VLCRLARTDLDEDDWFTAFDGVLDTWDLSAGAVTLHCKTDETALKSYVPNVQLLGGAFPGADETELTKYLPVVLGIHSAEGLTSQGMLPTLCIARNATYGYKYVVSLGTCASIPRVYKNGSLQTVTTHYTVAQETWGGALLTVISMVSATVATDAITCDAEGLTDDGTTTGSVILSPVEQLKWLCNNLIWNDWSGGTYHTDAPLDAAAFSAAGSYCESFDPEGSVYLGGSTEKTFARDVLKRWIESHPALRLRWNFDGTLAPVALDHRFSGYSDTNWLDGDHDELRQAPFRYMGAAEGTVAKVSTQYLYGEADAQFWQALEVKNLSRWAPDSGEPERGEERFDLRYSSARFQ